MTLSKMTFHIKTFSIMAGSMTALCSMLSSIMTLGTIQQSIMPPFSVLYESVTFYGTGPQGLGLML